MGIFKKIGNALKKTRESIARKLDSMLSHGELDDDFYDELTDVLISCDIGVRTSMDIVDQLRIRARKQKLRNADDVKNELKNILKEDFDINEKYNGKRKNHGLYRVRLLPVHLSCQPSVARLLSSGQR